MDNLVFMNPNDDKSVKETEKLNFISKVFRKDPFYKRVEIEGFELNYSDFKWEWIIKFKDTGAFMVLDERLGKNHIRIHAYEFAEDLNPTLYTIPDFKNNQVKRMVHLIKNVYYKIKK